MSKEMISYARIEKDQFDKMEKHRSTFQVRPSKVEYLSWLISQAFEHVYNCQDESENKNVD